MMRLLLACVCLTFLLAAPARAADVNLWACQTEAGAGLMRGPFFIGTANDGVVTGNCTTQADVLHAGLLPKAPAVVVQGQSEAHFEVFVPAGVTLTGVRAGRTAKGPGYTVTTSTGVLESESAGATLSAELNTAATGTFVRFSVFCAAALNASCPSDDRHVDLRYLVLKAQDTTPPAAAPGPLPDPATGPFQLSLNLSDAGAGLSRVVVLLDGVQIATGGYPDCTDLTPADASIDVKLGGSCPAADPALTIPVNITGRGTGPHALVVRVYDAAGNTTDAVNQTLNVVDPSATPVPTATASPAPAATPVPVATTAPAATATPAPEPEATPTPAPTTAQQVTIPKRPRVTRSGALSFTVRCPSRSSGRCTIRLTSGGKALATGRGSVAPGKRGKITLKLTAAARRTLTRRGTLKATLTLYAGTKRTKGVAVTVRTL